MTTLLTLSHILHKKNYHLLTINKNFITYFLNLIKKTITNNNHFIQIYSNIKHLTKIQKIFNTFSKIYHLKKNQNIINQIKKNKLTHQILLILKKTNLNKKLFTLQIIKSIYTFKIKKTIFQIKITQKNHLLQNKFIKH